MPKSAADLGQSFGLLSEREVNYLIDREWAHTADDILWRRSKLGLHLNDDEQAALRESSRGRVGCVATANFHGLRHESTVVSDIELHSTPPKKAILVGA